MFGSAESEHPRLINREIIFKEFQPTIHQRRRRTDGQTDRQTDNVRSQDRALHSSASRGKKVCNEEARCHAVNESVLMWKERGRGGPYGLKIMMMMMMMMDEQL